MNDKYGEEMILAEFDKEQSLVDLLSGINLKKLSHSLSLLLGSPFALHDASGALLAGEELTEAEQRRTIAPELEPLGELAVLKSDVARTDAAHSLLMLLLHNSSRYLMASSLHLQAIREDYNKLQQKHAELEASEARYRELSEQLELRVQDQIGVIEKSHRQLYQAEKMSAVGQLAAGVAHEINNPMGFIKSNLSTASGYVNDIKDFASELKQAATQDEIMAAWNKADMEFVMDDFAILLQESSEGAERVASIVADLKAFSNVDRAEVGIIKINELIERTCSVAKHQMQGRNLNLSLEALPKVRCQSGHIGQVLMNLLLNAVGATKPNGTVSVSSWLGEGERVHVSVSDDGEGIEADALEHVFEPFYTTKDVGSGTGLGLTVCRDIIRAHGGDISIQSEAGKGVTVTWWIPVNGQETGQ